MQETLNLKITHVTDTEKPFFMVTPTGGGYRHSSIYYPLFVGTLQEVAKFVSQCCNVTLEIAIDDNETRVEMSRTIDELR